jgi:hypothetical protein
VPLISLCGLYDVGNCMYCTALDLSNILQYNTIENHDSPGCSSVAVHNELKHAQSIAQGVSRRRLYFYPSCTQLHLCRFQCTLGQSQTS